MKQELSFYGGGKRCETRLARLLKQRIMEEGPISFRDFMAAALYDPQFGFYSKGPAIGTLKGPFYTNARYLAFAHALACAVEEAEGLVGGTLRIIELGGGTGQLASGIIKSLTLPHDYVIIEPSLGFRQIQAACGLKSVPSASAIPSSPSFVFGNEVLDAMPVHRVMGVGENKIVEQFLGIDNEGEFVEQFEEPSTPLLAERLRFEGITLGRGQMAEINLSLDELFESLSGVVLKGYVLFIDYGDYHQELYHYTRRNGSLRCFNSQNLVYDPFDCVGDQDLTTDVDFSAVEGAATQSGFLKVGKISQGRWLRNLGVEGYIEHSENILTAREEIQDLTSPTRLGSTFDVIGFKTVEVPVPPMFLG